MTSSNRSPRFTPRTVMALAISLLVVALVVPFGWFGYVWHRAEHEVDLSTSDHHAGLPEAPAAPEAVTAPAPNLPPNVPIPPVPPSAPSSEQGLPRVDSNPPDVFVIAESPPELVGGMRALQEEIRYPAVAKKAGIEGRVFLQFVVGTDGRVSNVVVTRGIGGGCDEEAIRAVKQMQFVPGTQRGKPVKVKWSVPVSFRLI